MSAGETISILINCLLAIYFIRIYPRALSKSFGDHPLPPLFAILARTIPLLGYLLLVGTLLYVVWSIIR